MPPGSRPRWWSTWPAWSPEKTGIWPQLTAFEAVATRDSALDWRHDQDHDQEAVRQPLEISARPLQARRGGETPRVSLPWRDLRHRPGLQQHRRMVAVDSGGRPA